MARAQETPRLGSFTIAPDLGAVVLERRSALSPLRPPPNHPSSGPLHSGLSPAILRPLIGSVRGQRNIEVRKYILLSLGQDRRKAIQRKDGRKIGNPHGGGAIA